MTNEDDDYFGALNGTKKLDFYSTFLFDHILALFTLLPKRLFHVRAIHSYRHAPV